MTKTITIGLVILSFIAGTVITASIANAAPGDQGKPFEALTEKFIDTDIGDLINRIEKLESVVQVDDDTGDVTIKSDNGNLNFDAANGKKVEFKKDASFEGDTTMKKNAKVMGNTEIEGDTTMKKNSKVMGNTEIEGDTTAMGTTTVSGTLTAETEATIGESLKIRTVGGSEGEFYVVVNEVLYPIGGLPGNIVSASCNDGDVAVGGGAETIPDWDFKTNGGFQDTAEPEEFVVRLASGNTEGISVTTMALCISIP
jgi:hypothetical protein